MINKCYEQSYNKTNICAVLRNVIYEKQRMKAKIYALYAVTNIIKCSIEGRMTLLSLDDVRKSPAFTHNITVDSKRPHFRLALPHRKQNGKRL